MSVRRHAPLPSITKGVEVRNAIERLGRRPDNDAAQCGPKGNGQELIFRLESGNPLSIARDNLQHEMFAEFSAVEGVVHEEACAKQAGVLAEIGG